MTTPATVRTLYRSYLTLDTSSDEVRDALTDSHRLHQLISRAYAHDMTDGNQRARADIGLLYSLDTDRPDGTSRLVCQAVTRPDWSVLAGSLQGHPYEMVDQEHLATGQTVHVQIDADPTKAIPAPRNPLRPDAPRGRGRRVRIDDPEERLEWAHRKLAIAGLDVAAITDSGTVHRDSRVKGLRLTLTRFTAVATVRAPDTLRLAQVEGVGRSRAYGAGLLLIRS